MDTGSTFDYVAFYDLDHTILVDNSATHLINEARKRGVMSEKLFRQAVWLSILYKLGIGNSTKMIIRMLSWLKGLKSDVVIQLCVEVFTEQIVDKIRPEILETIREHRSRKGCVVLLSSASSPICTPVAKYLKMDDLICSQLESVDGILTGNTKGKLVYEKEKENRLIAYCKEHRYSVAEAYYYGDSFTDEHVMSAVGHPVAVDPDKRLLRVAQKKNWEILIRNRA
ncbi:MAG: HAD-IB family hydrolase [Bacteroidetes bacterium]|nr:HAD-IB family hydrolase [Bacteroidota bacterium]